MENRRRSAAIRQISRRPYPLAKRVLEAQPMGELGEPRARGAKTKKKRVFAVWRKEGQGDLHACLLPQSPRVAARRATDGFQTPVWLHSHSNTASMLLAGPAVVLQVPCMQFWSLCSVHSPQSPTHLGKAFCLVSCVSLPIF